MFKKKSKKQADSSFTPKIHLDKKKTTITKRKKKKFSLKKKGKSKLTKRKKKRNRNYFFRILFLIAACATVIFLLYKAVFWIIELRSSSQDQGEQKSYVVGFNDLPTYPASTYIFEDESNSTISQFLTTGRSIYRLSRNNTIEQVFNYYTEELENTNWKHINSVPRTSHEMMYGEYYYNDKNGYGVRIYDRVNDIWYEKVTLNDAETGKAAHMSKKYERDLILSSDEGTPLLPDFPWSLTVPKEYLIKYFPTNESDLRGITFTELATGKETVFEPVSPLDAPADDIYIENYVSVLNVRTESESDTPDKWELVNTQYRDISGVYLLEGTVNHKTELTNIYILHNERVEYAYAIHTLDNDEVFLNFLLLNLSQQKLDYSGEEFDLDD